MFLTSFHQIFNISFRFLKVQTFGSIFSLKLSLKQETVLSSIKN